MSIVVIADTAPGLKPALQQIFAPHGGVEAVIPKNAGTIYVKPNGVYHTPHSHTDPAVLEAVLAYLCDHGYSRLAVMENCTAGSFTRLVFRVTGYTQICRRYGAEPVYLDEGPTVEVELRDGTRARVPRRLCDEIVNRGDNFYLNLPKLKTHPETKLTLGVKNQQAFPVHADRMDCHSGETLHRRLAALYALTQPDFCIIEGLSAIAHGNVPIEAFLEEYLVPMNILIGGPDTLAVDAVGARVLGYDLEEVEHLRLCAEWDLGEGDLTQIAVRGVPLSQFAARIPHSALRRFHPDVRWVVGRTKACVEGCRGNSELLHEILYNDQPGRGGWSLVCGSGFEDADFDDLPGDILVVGPCACEEAADTLQRRYPHRKLYQVPEHNDLMSNARYQARLMGMTVAKTVPLNPLITGSLLLQARLRGLTARVVPLLG